tara:strand:+ start:2542 stop:3633 length:1092 start_codon:yes stop_codon:yes gene_type:complete
MCDEVVSNMKILYDSNQKRAINISVRNRYISDIYNLAKTTMSSSSKFMVYYKRLYDFNQRRSIYLYRRHRYLNMLMVECEKECKRIKALNSVKEEVEKPEENNSVNVVSKSKKAALLIGINYRGKDNELYGCENDIHASKKMLMKEYGFKEGDIKVLMEQTNDASLVPTYKNIVGAINWLVKKSDEGYGSLWFQYSGHGYYFRDRDGDEKDGYDECLVTSDNYAIMDDYLRSHLINRVRADSKLFCLMDCCHSGTILDLQYKYLPSPSRRRMFQENKHVTKSNVWALSGCRDDQESADAEFSRNEWAGALTKNFMESLKKFNYKPKLDDLLSDVQSNLRRQGFTQVPQLTCSKNLSANVTFDV